LCCYLFFSFSLGRVAPLKGAVLGSEEWSPLFSYNSPEAELQLIRLQATGANWVRILVTYFQDSINTTTIYPIAKPSLFSTATDTELQFIINLAHSMGFKVLFSPIIDPNWEFSTNIRSGPNSTWRGQIGLYYTESQWAIWFSNYDKFISYYAAMAESLHVDLFVVGAELNTPFSRNAQFRAIVEKVRTIYHGNISAAINHDQALSNQNCTGGMVCEVTWCDTLDIIGIDAYFSLQTVSDSPTVEQIMQAWQVYVPQIENLSLKWNKSIVFVEIGYTSSFKAHAIPYQMHLISFDDCSLWALCIFLQEQQNCYEAFFRTFWSQNWFDGVFWWLWRTDIHDGFTSDPGFSPVGKPAEMVMNYWYHLEN
jgi:hypothetical protein